MMSRLIQSYVRIYEFYDTATQRVLNDLQGPGFLAVVWFGSSLSIPPPVSKLDRRHTGDRERETNCTNCCWREKEGNQITKSYDCKKAWPSINNAILSAATTFEKIKFCAFNVSDEILNKCIYYCKIKVVFWAGKNHRTKIELGRLKGTVQRDRSGRK